MAKQGYYPVSQSSSPGRWGLGAFIIAILLCFIVIGFIVFVYMLLVKPDGTLSVTYELRGIPTEEKTCPKCAEKIKSAALVCRYCGNQFSSTQEIIKEDPKVSSTEDLQTDKPVIEYDDPPLPTSIWNKIIPAFILISVIILMISVINNNSVKEKATRLKIGECVNTSIKDKGNRLEGVQDSGTSIIYENGIYGVSYDIIPDIVSSYFGDPIFLCLVEIEENCSDVFRGRTYSAKNMRTGANWVLPNSSHMCDGA